MIRSMTAYASAESTTPLGLLSCEVRSVNHRYLELSPRLPEELRSIEPQLRERVAARLTRGKVDVGLRLRSQGAAIGRLEFNEPLLAQLEQAAQRLGARFPAMSTDFVGLLAVDGVLVKPEIDQGEIHTAAFAVLDRALDDLVATRQREGERLCGFITERLDGIAATVAQVRQWLPDIRAALRAKLETRLADFRQTADPARLEQELVLQLSRIDVDEELDRLTAHLAETRRILKLADANGRRLDFLMQEFNREANTLGSKSVDQRTTQAAVELKVLIEQMREQVQNIE
ncbi:YicC/YloC family endoribonuclease [Tahibacter amnicola]|uniref:YicC family protein n=1 Tax=Tahibacter amnicola TaxID=2976241 RepID=A0ABY6BCY0_9GAMM|nr:YicC/YloC family endoribonuclease [Tahibacter amnicola]UXI67898.1 YicC family protein [Tahibacter amnicola]